tara:strand:+ start:157 stop:684 length:528 start_codon:yes stop_codon:yes gene_type:complete
MKIKKNGKVIKLTESDLKKIVKKVLVTEAVAAAPNIALKSNDAKIMYFNGRKFSTSGNLTLEPGDTFKMAIMIPSSSSPGSPVAINKAAISGGKITNTPQKTANTSEATHAKKAGVDTPSFVFLRAEFDDLASVAKMKGKDATLSLTGNFEGGPNVSVPVAIPSEMNVIQGSAKS